MIQKFTNEELIHIIDGLNGGGDDALAKRKLPAKIVYAVIRSAASIEGAYKAYFETLKSLHEQYGVTLEKPVIQDPDPVKRKELQKALQDEIRDLVQTEVEVSVCPIKEEWLENYDDSRYDPLSVTDMKLFYMLVDKGAEEAKKTEVK